MNEKIKIRKLRRSPPATIVIKEFSKKGLDKWRRRCWAVAKSTSCICSSYEQWTFLPYTVTEIQNIYSQKWNCTASFPISTFMYLGAIFSHNWAYLESLFSCIAWENSAGAERRAGNCRQALVGSSSRPSPPLLWLSRENDRHTNFQFGKLWIINVNVVNFLFPSLLSILLSVHAR